MNQMTQVLIDLEVAWNRAAEEFQTARKRMLEVEEDDTMPDDEFDAVIAAWRTASDRQHAAEKTFKDFRTTYRKAHRMLDCPDCNERTGHVTQGWISGTYNGMDVDVEHVQCMTCNCEWGW